MPGPVSHVCAKTWHFLVYMRNTACTDCEIKIVTLWVLKATAVTSAPKRIPDMVTVNIGRLAVSPFSLLKASGLTVLVKSTVGL